MLLPKVFREKCPLKKKNLFTGRSHDLCQFINFLRSFTLRMNFFTKFIFRKAEGKIERKATTNNCSFLIKQSKIPSKFQNNGRTRAYPSFLHPPLENNYCLC